MKTTSQCGGMSSEREETMLQDNITISSNIRLCRILSSPRLVESKCNIFVIPKRDVQQSGVGIKPLNHSKSTTAERKVLKKLINKIGDLGTEPCKIHLLVQNTLKQRRPSQDINNKTFLENIGEAK